MTSKEPQIVTWGRNYVSEYPEQEFVDSLMRAFNRDRADFIVLDGNMRGQKFLAAGVAWAIDRGWLFCDRHEEYDQETVSTFRLTPEGRAALGI